VSKSAPPAGLENINSALYEKFSKLNAELNNMLQDMIKTDEFTSEQSEKLLKAAADLNKTVKIRDEIDKLASHL
jgi:tRNA-binding EMAP/Myf-like protein